MSVMRAIEATHSRMSTDSGRSMSASRETRMSWSPEMRRTMWSDMLARWQPMQVSETSRAAVRMKAWADQRAGRRAWIGRRARYVHSWTAQTCPTGRRGALRAHNTGGDTAQSTKSIARDLRSLAGSV